MKKVYCVTVDPTSWSNEIWPFYAEECEVLSDIEGDQNDLGTSWQVWLATTNADNAFYMYDKLKKELGSYVIVEEVVLE